MHMQMHILLLSSDSVLLAPLARPASTSQVPTMDFAADLQNKYYSLHGKRRCTYESGAGTNVGRKAAPGSKMSGTKRNSARVRSFYVSFLLSSDMRPECCRTFTDMAITRPGPVWRPTVRWSPATPILKNFRRERCIRRSH